MTVLGMALALSASASPAKVMLDRADDMACLAQNGICGEQQREAEIATLNQRFSLLVKTLSQRTGEDAGLTRLDGPRPCAEADHYERHIQRYKNTLRDAATLLGEER